MQRRDFRGNIQPESRVLVSDGVPVLSTGNIDTASPPDGKGPLGKAATKSRIYNE